MCLAIIAHLCLDLWQKDFVVACLNSNNEYKVYTEQAPCFITAREENLVYRTNKTLYGMMVSAHDWEKELSKTYNTLSYYQSKADLCVQHWVIDGEYMLQVTYTNDVIGGSMTKKERLKAIGELEGAYHIKQIKEEGKDRHILWMSLTRNEETGAITISERPYFERILKKFGMEDCNPKYTSLPAGIVFTPEDNAITPEQIEFMKDKPFLPGLSSFMWGESSIRPDLA